MRTRPEFWKVGDERKCEMGSDVDDVITKWHAFGERKEEEKKNFFFFWEAKREEKLKGFNWRGRPGMEKEKKERVSTSVERGIRQSQCLGL